MFMLARALPAQAQARVSAIDGTRWNELDQSLKVGYAVGFIQGVTFGESLIIVGFVSVGSDEAAMVKAHRLYHEYAVSLYSDLSVEQVVDGLDAFYKDHRNTNIQVDQATWVIAHEVHGTPQADVLKMTEDLRRGAMSEPKKD